MGIEHICRERPEFQETDDPWADGPVSDCLYHDKRGRSQIRVRGIGERRAADKQAGVVGTQRDGYISGRDSGR